MPGKANLLLEKLLAGLSERGKLDPCPEQGYEGARAALFPAGYYPDERKPGAYPSEARRYPRRTDRSLSVAKGAQVIKDCLSYIAENHLPIPNATVWMEISKRYTP